MSCARAPERRRGRLPTHGVCPALLAKELHPRQQVVALPHLGGDGRFGAVRRDEMLGSALAAPTTSTHQRLLGSGEIIVVDPHVVVVVARSQGLGVLDGAAKLGDEGIVVDRGARSRRLRAPPRDLLDLGDGLHPGGDRFISGGIGVGWRIVLALVGGARTLIDRLGRIALVGSAGRAIRRDRVARRARRARIGDYDLVVTGTVAGLDGR